MAYKNIDQKLVLEANKERDFEQVMNDFEELLLRNVTLISPKGVYASDSLISTHNIKIIIQRQNDN